MYQISVDQSVKLGRTVLPLHLDLRQVDRTSGVQSLEASARASASFRALTFTGQLDWARTKVPIGPDPPDNLSATLLANARIGRVRLRGETRFALSGGSGPIGTLVRVQSSWPVKVKARKLAEARAEASRLCTPDLRSTWRRSRCRGSTVRPSLTD